MPKIRDPFDIFTAGAHHKDSAATAVGMKSDLLAIGRENRLRVVRGRVLCEVHRILAADSLRVDVPVPRGAAGVHERLAVRRQAWVELFPRLVGELNKPGVYQNRRSGATTRPPHPPC